MTNPKQRERAEEILKNWKQSETFMSDWRPPYIPSDRAFMKLISLARDSALEEAEKLLEFKRSQAVKWKEDTEAQTYGYATDLVRALRAESEEGKK